jgi:hypothetical protein
MQSFTDSSGVLWDVNVTVETVRRVKRLIDVDLLDAVKGEFIAGLADDPVQLADVLYCVCKPQADKLGVTDEQFGERLAGDVIDHATAALLEALVNFFPKRQRSLLELTAATVNEALALASEKDKARMKDPRVLKKISQIVDAENERLIASLDTVGSRSISSPASSESTPQI